MLSAAKDGSRFLQQMEPTPVRFNSKNISFRLPPGADRLSGEGCLLKYMVSSLRRCAFASNFSLSKTTLSFFTTHLHSDAIGIHQNSRTILINHISPF